MKISHAPYILKARARLNSVSSSTERVGALLRVEWNTGEIGYADCFPWPELGDASLQVQLASLCEPGARTPLIERALAHAHSDALARLHKQSLWMNLQIPPSHFLVLDFTTVNSSQLAVLADQGFRTLKLKLDRSLRVEALNHVLKLCAGQWKLRFDSNQAFNAREALDIASQLEYLHDIEFWEDPCPYDPSAWRVLSEIVPLALDRIPDASTWPGLLREARGFRIFVHKPALQNSDEVMPFLGERAVCVTSYLDHPIGQCFAAWNAGRLAKSGQILHCGLQTHHAFEANAFSEVLGPVSPLFTIPPGHGIGFDELLSNQHWKPLP